MAKVVRATDQLNLALSRVSAATSITANIADDLPDGELKRQVLVGCEQMSIGIKEAFEHLGTIRKAAESI